MYIPSYFKIEDNAIIFDIINSHSFATLISQHENQPFATHLPLILNEEKTDLYGHFARPNPQWKTIQGQTVLAIFHGPHAYISPSWYETNQAVPTWNYVTVHVYGNIEWIPDKELMTSLDEMVRKYEAPTSSYQLEGVDTNYLKGMHEGVQGFKLKIKQMEGKAKLSQNHPLARQQLVINQLEKKLQTNEQQIARLMRENVNSNSRNT